MSGPLRGGSTWPRSSISSPGAWSVGRVVSRFFCTFVQATASVRMTCDKPNAIAAQNLLSSSRPAPAGRPGEGNGALPERSERRRFNLVIVTPHEALRRLLESAQYSSEQFQRLMADHGAVCSMSRSGNGWDNAAMESFFSSLKTERTARKTYRTRDEARATCRLHRTVLQREASSHDDWISEPYGVRDQGWISLSGCHPNRVQAKVWSLEMPLSCSPLTEKLSVPTGPALTRWAGKHKRS